VAGALIGVVIGVAGGNPVTNMLVSSSTTASLPSTAQTSSGGARFAGGGRFFGTRSVTGNFLQRSGNGLLNSASNVTTNIGWSILAYGLAASLLIAAIGSSFAGWMIARVKPYEVMRAE
jgi:ABC-type antimicrobial peptide transport system permease subunit